MQRGRKERQEADFKRVSQTWNTMELDDEGSYLNQQIISSRVETLLRSYGLATSPSASSATALAAAAGVSSDPSTWGADMTIESSYRGPHLCWPLTKQCVEGILHHIRNRPQVSLHPKYMAQLLGQACLHFRRCSTLHRMQVLSRCM